MPVFHLHAKGECHHNFMNQHCHGELKYFFFLGLKSHSHAFKQRVDAQR